MPSSVQFAYEQNAPISLRTVCTTWHQQCATDAQNNNHSYALIWTFEWEMRLPAFIFVVECFQANAVSAHLAILSAPVCARKCQIKRQTQMQRRNEKKNIIHANQFRVNRRRCVAPRRTWVARLMLEPRRNGSPAVGQQRRISFTLFAHRVALHNATAHAIRTGDWLWHSVITYYFLCEMDYSWVSIKIYSNFQLDGQFYSLSRLIKSELCSLFYTGGNNVGTRHMSCRKCVFRASPLPIFIRSTEILTISEWLQHKNICILDAHSIISWLRSEHKVYSFILYIYRTAKFLA